jgi:hypothetical protein
MLCSCTPKRRAMVIGLECVDPDMVSSRCLRDPSSSNRVITMNRDLAAGQCAS